MWLFLGIASGFLNACQSAVNKVALKDLNHYLVAFASTAFSLIVYLTALIWTDTVPLDRTFWIAAITSSILGVIALILMMKALSIGELSRTVPFLSFTPAFLILTSNLMLGELPNLTGFCGIFLITGGAYMLEATKGGGILGPFWSFSKNKGGQLALLVAFIYAITSSLDKVTIQHSNAFTRNVIVLAIMSTLLLFLVLFKSKQGLNEIKPKFPILIMSGLFGAGTIFCQMAALSTSMVSYVISLKRTSALFSILLGYVAFKERNIKPKLLGAALMVAGVILISIS